MRRLVIRDLALREARDAWDWYESQQAGLGARFSRQLTQALVDVRQDPLLWRAVGGGYRRRNCRDFPYGVVYRLDGDAVVVVAVMHLSRRPRYWKGRA